MKFHPVLHKSYQNWDELEAKIEKLPTSKQKGDAFEDFIYAYLELKKDFYQIDAHWQYSDAPIDLKESLSMEINDSGADGLIRFRDGTIAAYQVKFRTGRKAPRYDELAKLWAEARECDYQYTIANCNSLTKLARKNDKHLQILCNEFINLDNSFFGSLEDLIKSKEVTKQFFKPDSHQIKMIDAVKEGFKGSDRGKLISACGTGKTLTSLWVTENQKVDKLLFVAPNISLVKQTIEEWSKQSKFDFDYLCVCSDKTVTNKVDNGDIRSLEIGIPVTTSPEKIKKFLKSNLGNKKYIFSTYQSLENVSKACKGTDFSFDLAIFDEAHRTAGKTDNSGFTKGLNNKFIKANKRLFMTATERLVKPWIIEKAESYNQTIFSMDDKKLYGEVFYRYSFGLAIQESVISDYKIIIAGIEDKEIYDWIKHNKTLEDTEESGPQLKDKADNIFKQLLLLKSFKQLPIKKCITFHSSIVSAKQLIYGKGNSSSLENLIPIMWKELNPKDIYLDHINGTMSSVDRVNRFDTFSQRKYGVISNSKCLTEGIDVPVIDSIYFVNPKHSLIDIIQACGRALRKPRNIGNKVSYFIVPILISDDSDKNQESFNKIDFEMIHNLIQSLRDQDDRLEDWIDRLNLGIGTSPNGGNGGSGPIEINLPDKFNISEFEKKLHLRISEVNGNPSKYITKKKLDFKGSRKSNIKRVYRSLGDYSVQSYEKKLVEPTIRKFETKNQELSLSDLKINNNNVSHTERLGLIESTDKVLFTLTELGREFYESKHSFKEVFQSQMLRFFEDRKIEGQELTIFPYRFLLKLMRETKQINFYEFAFCVYSLKSTNGASLKAAINGVNHLRSKFPKLKSLNISNRLKVLEQLNSFYGTKITETDIWDRRTTINNQWIYLRNHCCLFEDLIKYDKNYDQLVLKKDSLVEINRLIDGTEIIEKAKSGEQRYDLYRRSFVTFKKFNIDS